MVELQVKDLDGWWTKIQKIVQGDAFPECERTYFLSLGKT